MNNAEKIFQMDWISTESLATMALNWHVYGDNNPDGFHHVWQYIATTAAEADAFYVSIEDDEELRGYAAEALGAAGWDNTKIGFRLS